MRDTDRYHGCLIGGAVGDALGYAVEFWDEGQIFSRYGEKGITEYAMVDGAARISDDTQMTLFTANGLLIGTTLSLTQGHKEPYLSCIAACYRDWLRTQAAEEFGFEPPEISWLNNLPEMNHSRAPGNTCIRSLLRESLGSVADPINNSKGCGGVMRVAPIGLYFEGKHCAPEQIDMLGAEAAALTHGHELGYSPAAMLVHIVQLLAHNADATVLQAVEEAKAAAVRLFSQTEHLGELLALIDRAVSLAADSGADDPDNIRKLGQGWVADEALAIAVYCSVRYDSDFEKAVIAAVNHGGDSDSTGAVTGNILGAHLGIKAIPEKFLTGLELRDTILEIADDLFCGSEISEERVRRDEVWSRKYITHTYPN